MSEDEIQGAEKDVLQKWKEKIDSVPSKVGTTTVIESIDDAVFKNAEPSVADFNSAMDGIAEVLYKLDSDDPETSKRAVSMLANVLYSLGDTYEQISGGKDPATVLDKIMDKLSDEDKVRFERNLEKVLSITEDMANANEHQDDPRFQRAVTRVRVQVARIEAAKLDIETSDYDSPSAPQLSLSHDQNRAENPVKGLGKDANYYASQLLAGKAIGHDQFSADNVVWHDIADILKDEFKNFKGLGDYKAGEVPTPLADATTKDTLMYALPVKKDGNQFVRNDAVAAINSPQESSVQIAEPEILVTSPHLAGLFAPSR